MRHGRVSALFRWSGTALSLSLLVLYVLSSRWIVGHPVYNSAGSVQAYLNHIAAGQLVVRIPLTNGQRDGFGFDTHSIAFSWWFHIQHFPLAKAWLVGVPLWFPLLIVAIPTAIAWERARRYAFGPGRCHRCGYPVIDLTRCPECGDDRLNR
jgi:hypothetical protein